MYNFNLQLEFSVDQVENTGVTNGTIHKQLVTNYIPGDINSINSAITDMCSKIEEVKATAESVCKFTGEHYRLRRAYATLTREDGTVANEFEINDEIRQYVSLVSQFLIV